MSDNRKSSSWPWIIAGAVMLPVLYVLSIGPVFWIANYFGPLPEPVLGGLRCCYVPVLWVASNSAAGEQLLNFYISLWT